MNTDYLTLIMKVTNKCNLDCPYCYTRSTIHNGEDMSLDTFKNAVIKGSMATKNLTIIFHGGEPTLRSYEWYKEALDFVNHIREITSCNIQLAIQTNLTLFDEKKFRLFKARNVNIGFSFDSITNDLTRKNGDKIISNFNKLSSSPFNFKSGCICLITKDNYKKLINIADNFNKLNMMYDIHIAFNTITMIDNKNNIEINSLINEYKNFINYILGKENYHIPYTIMTYINYILKKEKYLCKNIDCRLKWLGINPNGDVMPCGNEWLQKNKKYLFGNINKNSIDDIFNCDNYKIFSNKIDAKNTNCKNCDVFDFCNGGCPAEDFSNVGDVGQYDYRHCRLTKEILNFIKLKIHKKDIKNNFIIKEILNG